MPSSSQPQLLSRLILLALAVPVVGFCTAIEAIGTTGPTVCEVGSCPQSDTQAASLGLNQSSGSDFIFAYRFTNGDTFLVTGSYANSYDNNGSHVNFDPFVEYIGNNGDIHANSAGIDVLSLIMLQNFFDPLTGVWDGTACEHLGTSVPTNAVETATLSYGGVPISTLTAGPGLSNQSACNYLAFSPAQNASDYLDSSYNLTDIFGAGTKPGAAIVQTPEPAQMIPTAVSLICVGAGVFVAGRRRRRAMAG